MLLFFPFENFISLSFACSFVFVDFVMLQQYSSLALV